MKQKYETIENKFDFLKTRYLSETGLKRVPIEDSSKVDLNNINCEIPK